MTSVSFKNITSSARKVFCFLLLIVIKRTGFKKIKMNKQTIFILLAVIAVVAVAVMVGNNKNGQVEKKYDGSDNQQINMNAIIKTSLGEIKVELYANKVPRTVQNFANLAEGGFYNGIKFHRVISEFMIQGGDPLTKDDTQKQLWGTGGPGYKFDDEPFEGQYSRGTLAMANLGPNTNGSQFFIMHQDYPLPPNYVIFGNVIEGIDVVDKIAALETDSRDCPLEPPVIESVDIER